MCLSVLWYMHYHYILPPAFSILVFLKLRGINDCTLLLCNLCQYTSLVCSLITIYHNFTPTHLLATFPTMADILPRLLSFPRHSDLHTVSDEEYDEQIRKFIAYLKEYLPNRTDEASETVGLLKVCFYVVRYRLNAHPNSENKSNICRKSTLPSILFHSF